MPNSWLAHLPDMPHSAHLIEERIISHLDPCAVPMARNGHFYHWLDVVAQELSGFKHLHPNLQKEHTGDSMLGAQAPILIQDSSLKIKIVLTRNILGTVGTERSHGEKDRRGCT
jgi:hypothetical protein